MKTLFGILFFVLVSHLGMTQVEHHYSYMDESESMYQLTMRDDGTAELVIYGGKSKYQGSIECTLRLTKNNEVLQIVFASAWDPYGNEAKWDIAKKDNVLFELSGDEDQGIITTWKALKPYNSKQTSCECFFRNYGDDDDAPDYDEDDVD